MPYSVDLRERVVGAIHSGMTRTKASAIYNKKLLVGSAITLLLMENGQSRVVVFHIVTMEIK